MDKNFLFTFDDDKFGKRSVSMRLESRYKEPLHKKDSQHNLTLKVEIKSSFFQEKLNNHKEKVFI